MLTCEYCVNLKKCIKDANDNGFEHNEHFDGEEFCPNYGFKRNTNADRIRAMSDEELAKILNAFTTYFEECNRSIAEIDCHDCELFELCSLGEGKAIDWLKQPAEERQ
jgi:hypothetical protein